MPWQMDNTVSIFIHLYTVFTWSWGQRVWTVCTACSHTSLATTTSALHLQNINKMPVIKFSYFDMEAKGELTRLLLHAGNFDFEDDRIPFQDWPGEHKAASTFGQLPVLRWDGVELAQSMAIARLILSFPCSLSLPLLVCRTSQMNMY